MAKKQAITTKPATAAAPARVAKPKAPRVSSSKHSKSVAQPEEVPVHAAPVHATPVHATPVSAAPVKTVVNPAAVKAAVTTKVPVAELTVAEAAVEMPAAPEVSATPVKAAVSENPHEAISKLAWGYWSARGFHGGNPLEDWVRAEREYYQNK